MTAETALRFARYFGTSAQMWMNLQTAYDLEIAQRKAGKSISLEVLRADSNVALPANLEL